MDPATVKALIHVADQARTKEGRKRILTVLMIPICLIAVAVGLVAFIISASWSELSDYFSGDDLLAAEGIFTAFNSTGIDPNFVFYSQYDSRWATSVSYDGDLFKITGDGPACLAMVLSTYTDETVLPPTIAQWLTDNGMNSGDGSGTKEDAIKYTITTYPSAVTAGLTCSDAYDADSWSTVKTAITAGNTVAIAEVSGGVFTGAGTTVSALYTAYYPGNDAMNGYGVDASGNTLDPSKLTCAAPKSIPLGTKILISGTGTEMDGKIYTVTDRGGAITVKNGVYHFDLLFSTYAECMTWGKKSGQATILSSTSTGSGTSRFVVVTGTNLNDTYNVADPVQNSAITVTADELESAVKKAWVITAPNYGFAGDGFGNYSTASAYGWICPLESGTYRISSKFGYRTNPVSGIYKLHAGIDMAAAYGTPIMAVADGTIISVKSTSGGYGNLTVIDHGNGIQTYYGHQSSRVAGLTVGTKVKQGQIIGYVGSTGASTGNHLHFGVKFNGSFVNPASYINY